MQTMLTAGHATIPEPVESENASHAEETLRDIVIESNGRLGQLLVIRATGHLRFVT
jgi:hypothetical protein